MCKESCLNISNDIESEYAFNMSKQIWNLMPKRIAAYKLFGNTESLNDKRVRKKRVLDIYSSKSRALCVH